MLNQQKPQILLTANPYPEYDGISLRLDYLRQLELAGALPLVCSLNAAEDAEQMARSFAGLLLTGGGDLHPHLFGQRQLVQPRAYCAERDALELALVRQFWQLGKPILGICRGLQLLNVALGGTLLQDLALAGRGQSIEHDQAEERYVATHAVEILEPRLQALLGRSCRVNSHHHQVVEQVAEPLQVAAQADDGEIEALVSKDAAHWCVAVQWHAECFSAQQSLFRSFVRACRR